MDGRLACLMDIGHDGFADDGRWTFTRRAPGGKWLFPLCFFFFNFLAASHHQIFLFCLRLLLRYFCLIIMHMHTLLAGSMLYALFRQRLVKHYLRQPPHPSSHPSPRLLSLLLSLLLPLLRD
ncbi:hypothetical protein BC567DRAFT_900 [Phyllosticta citribraziliensis]